jgi:hypothetical protein
VIIEPTRRHFAVGVDLGKAAETTAIAVAERLNPSGWDGLRECPPEKARLQVRQLRRFPPGTYYREIGKGLAEVLKSVELTATKEHADSGALGRIIARVDLIVDQTVVGTPVTDMILREAGVLSARRVAISGNQAETSSDGIDRIPKQTLIGGLEVLLETGRLKIAESLPAAQQLADELVNYRGRKTPNAPLTVDTWRELQNDDLLFAVAIATHELTRPQFTYEFYY